VEVSAAGRRSRSLAALLVRYLQEQHADLYAAIRDGDPLDAVAADPTVTITFVEEAAGSACSVAGMCDVDRRAIRVMCASLGRMRYTVLHELGHILMAECDDYQDAYVELAPSVPDRGRLTEDVCEAFAASLLLPETQGEIEQHNFALDARGLLYLTRSFPASREACAVWVSQRMGAPGYALICSDEGELQFAARSGDALPLSRGASQAGSALQPLLSGGQSLRGRGRLRFASGALGQELYFDAVRDGRLIYCIATTDSPDWPVLHATSKGPAVEAIEGWCDNCCVTFRAYRLCPDCGVPKHEDCGACDCEVDAGDQMCTRCFLYKHRNLFDGSSTVCRECLT
jgi:hypothetical protein